MLRSEVVSFIWSETFCHKGKAEFLFQLYSLTMCGRFRLTRADKLAERFDIVRIENLRPR